MNPDQTVFDLVPPTGEPSGPIEFDDEDHVVVVDPDNGRGYLVVGDGEEHGLKDNTVYALVEISTLVETRHDLEDEMEEGDDDEGDDDGGEDGEDGDED